MRFVYSIRTFPNFSNSNVSIVRLCSYIQRCVATGWHIFVVYERARTLEQLLFSLLFVGSDSNKITKIYSTDSHSGMAILLFYQFCSQYNANENKIINKYIFEIQYQYLYISQMKNLFSEFIDIHFIYFDNKNQ